MSLPKKKQHSRHQSLKLPQSYPEDITRVLDGPSKYHGSIYIGNIEAAENIKSLQSKNIAAVISVCKEASRIQHPRSIRHLVIPAADHQTYDIARYFDSAIKFLEDSLPSSNVLVHCMAGISRSVTLVLAYFMSKLDYSFNQAFSVLKKRRPIIHPNSGFIQQLKQFELRLAARNSVQDKQNQSKSAKDAWMQLSAQKSHRQQQGLQTRKSRDLNLSSSKSRRCRNAEQVQEERRKLSDLSWSKDPKQADARIRSIRHKYDLFDPIMPENLFEKMSELSREIYIRRR